jgi:hypothetical protein
VGDPHPDLGEDHMKKTPSYPKVQMTFSINEIIAMCMMFKVATTWTHPKELIRVKAVLLRLEKKLEACGIPREYVDMLVKL